MFEYRITKYDQSQRDERGRYICPSAWTCYSDVGDTYDGKVLTLEECLRVESAYIATAIKMFEHSGLPFLRLTRVEAPEWQKDDLRQKGKPLYDDTFETIDFSEDAIVHLKEMPAVLQMVFRGFGYASLEWRNKFYVHVGWDFYMYVGTDKPAHKEDSVRSADLYIENDFPSPHKVFNLPSNILHIERSKRGQEYIDEGFEINLTADLLEKLKPIWGFSDEHPFLGHWRINPHVKGKIEEILGQAFDFETYDYFLQTVGWDDRSPKRTQTIFL